MAKKVIKEIIIMLLICLAVIFILGVLVYDYVPSNKMIPNEVIYKTSQDVERELSKEIENDEIILTYSIDSTDLDNYERIHTYLPGKPNPFSPYHETSTEENITQNENSVEINNNTNSEVSTETNHTTENIGNTEYYPNTGTK